MKRIKSMLMSFPTAFQFAGMRHPAPAGMYEITIEEEPLGDGYPIYERVSTSIYLPLPGDETGIGQILFISREALERQRASLSLVI